MKMLIAILSLVAGTIFSGAASAEWRLSPDESRISFVSVKAGDFPESHHFTEMDGNVGADGAAAITIALDSVETLIDIRNERMREFLFETDEFPTAEIAASIDLDALDDLGVGARKEIPFTGELALRGATAPIDAVLIVTRIAEDRVLVETADPIILFTDDFNLAAGVRKLMELASLPSITPASPVTASLVFERAD